MKLHRWSIATLGLIIFAGYTMPSAHAQFGDLIKKGQDKVNRAKTNVERPAQESNTPEPTAPERNANGNEEQSTQAIEPTPPANDPPGPADGTSSGVRNGNSRVVNGYEVPTNPNRIVFARSPISATDPESRQTTLRRFVAGEPIYALASMNAQLDPTSSWSVRSCRSHAALSASSNFESGRTQQAKQVSSLTRLSSTTNDSTFFEGKLRR